MKETATLEILGTGTLIQSILLFLAFFTVLILVSFILRVITLGFYKVNFNKKFLRKYIEYSGVISARR